MLKRLTRSLEKRGDNRKLVKNSIRKKIMPFYEERVIDDAHLLLSSLLIIFAKFTHPLMEDNQKQNVRRECVGGIPTHVVSKVERFD